MDKWSDFAESRFPVWGKIWVVPTPSPGTRPWLFFPLQKNPSTFFDRGFPKPCNFEVGGVENLLDQSGEMRLEELVP